MPQRTVPVSSRLGDVRYEIRGALSRRARELEAEGRQIIRLNIGNPGLFGFTVPAHVRAAVESHLDRSEAYCHQQGLQGAREAWATQDPGPLAPDEARSLLTNLNDEPDLLLRGILWSHRPDVAWGSGQPYPGGRW